MIELAKGTSPKKSRVYAPKMRDESSLVFGARALSFGSHLGCSVLGQKKFWKRVASGSTVPTFYRDCLSGLARWISKLSSCRSHI